MRHQKRSEPACPAQNDVKRYAFGRFALVNDATYLNEKSCVKIAVQRPSDASTTIASVAEIARSPLATRSRRPIEPPAKETVAAQAAMRRATQSDSSPTRITLAFRRRPPLDLPAATCTCRRLSQVRSHTATRISRGESWRGRSRRVRAFPLQQRRHRR